MNGLFSLHEERLRAAVAANRARGQWSAFVESPSRKLHAEGAAARGDAAFQALLGRRFSLDQPGEVDEAGGEESPFTRQPLGIRYPVCAPAALVEAAEAARPAWTAAGPRARVGLCMEMLDALAALTFVNAHATQHTAGQAFMMAFAGSGANSLDRGLEALAMAHTVMSEVPERAVFTRRFGAEPVTLDKRYRWVGRGVAVVFSCATYPAWNAYPAMFANLATGNPVIVKPHPSCVLPMALAVQACRRVLADFGFPPDLVSLAVDPPGGLVGLTLVDHPAVRLVDFTGGPEFGRRLEARGRLVYTETAGCNAVVIDSADDLDAVVDAVAHSLCLFSSQMCTAAQNVFVPASGVRTPSGAVTHDEVVARLLAAVDRWALGPHAAAVCGAVQSERTWRDIEALAAAAGGAVIRRSAPVRNDEHPRARTASPLIVAAEASQTGPYRREHFGPMAFVIRAASARDALGHAARDAAEVGAISTYVYSTDEGYVADAEEAFWAAGASLGVNLVAQRPINFAAAYSDHHVTGLNPAGTATLTDPAFVADRLRVVMSKRERG